MRMFYVLLCLCREVSFGKLVQILLVYFLIPATHDISHLQILYQKLISIFKAESHFDIFTHQHG